LRGTEKYNLSQTTTNSRIRGFLSKIKDIHLGNFIPHFILALYRVFFFLIHLIIGVEESIVNLLYTLRITDLTFYTSGTFTIDSSTPTTRWNLKKTPDIRVCYAQTSKPLISKRKKQPQRVADGAERPETEI
jgi:hypothetical protein